MEEIWKSVPGYEKYYEVSNLGRIKRIEGRNAGRILKGWLNGYLQIDLRVGDIYKPVPIHRIVAMAFIPNPENKPEVNHINGIKTDNRAENLEWVTHQENCIHAWQIGLCNVTNDFRDKMREVRLGRKHNEESIKKMSEAHRGKQASAETRKKLSESHKGLIWVNDGTNNYLVRPEKLQEYLNKGYLLGMIKTKQ